jgi:hypothetical protein
MKPPLAQLAIEFVDLQRAEGDLVKLLGVSAVGAFDRAIEFGGTRRKHEQAQAMLLIGGFELGGELAAAIDLQTRMGNPTKCTASTI